MTEQRARITPSLYAADPLHLADALKAAVNAGADGLHFDVMDGVFVPEIGLNSLQLDAVLAASELPVDVHLMTVESRRMAEAFARPGVRTIILHPESQPVEELQETLAAIRGEGRLAWLALSPSTPVGIVDEFIGWLDGVLVMSCAPGQRGANYIAATPQRIAALRRRVGPDVTIGVDGGLDDARGTVCIRAGADLLVIGRSFFKSRVSRPLQADALSFGEP